MNTSLSPFPAQKTLTNAYIELLQKRHFWLCDVLPAVGFFLSLIIVWGKPLTWVNLFIFLMMCGLNSIGISVGYHRYFTHRSFQAHQGIRILLVILGSMGAQGPVISWVANHRHHHAYSDRPEDTHSPHNHDNRLQGLIHAHLTWKIAYPYANPLIYAPELLKDKVIMGVSKAYWLWIMLGLILPGAIALVLTRSWIGALEGFCWGGLMRLYFAQQSTWCINSICHAFGTSPFATNDESKNNLWLAILTFGESWHNNHHAFQNSARFGLKWWQIDLGYLTLQIWQKLGLVWDVHQPSEVMILAKSKKTDSK